MKIMLNSGKQSTLSSNVPEIFCLERFQALLRRKSSGVLLQSFSINDISRRDPMSVVYKSDSLVDPVKFRCLIFTGCLPDKHRQGSPVFIVVWLPLRVTPDTPGVHLSVTVVFVRIDAAAFPCL